MRVPGRAGRAAGRAAWLAAAVGALWAAAQARPEQVVDRVIAVARLRGSERDPGGARARSELITSSDLELEAAVALVQSGATGAATAKLDAEALASALELAITHRLHALEADKLNAFRIEPDELDAAEAAFRERLGSEAAFERFLAFHDVDRRRLRITLERALRAGRMLDSKVRLRAQVDEAEVRRYYDAQPSAQATPYEELRPLLKEKLTRERYQALVREETERLRRGADVRIIHAVGDGA